MIPAVGSIPMSPFETSLPLAPNIPPSPSATLLPTNVIDENDSPCLDSSAMVSIVDLDKDGVDDCHDYCPGTDLAQHQQQDVSAVTVNEFGCFPLYCSFGMMGQYMGISNDGQHQIVGNNEEILFELVACLDDDEHTADCVAADGERCVSIRLHDDPTMYWDHSDGWLYMSRANSIESFPCTQASFCMSPGLDFEQGTFTDRSSATFRAVYRSEFIFVNADGMGPVLVQSRGEFANWSFQCRHGVVDLWAFITEQGITPPIDVPCVLRQ